MSEEKRIIGLFLYGLMFCACAQNASDKNKGDIANETLLDSDKTIIIQDGNTILSRFNSPEGYERQAKDSVSFASFLRNLPLKSPGSEVLYYDGRTKPNPNVYEAVIDLPIGTRDLHQCADAVMRLRADYLFSQKKYDSIHFNFTNGFKADYATWRKGKRIVVNGNQVFWKQKGQPSDSSKDFWKYLEMVFSYAGTASLEKELKSVPLNDMQIGDVFIKGGFPGHAVIIVDMAVDKSTKDKIFLLAQSYMPAQEIQLLKNPNDDDISPWYSVSDISGTLRTPEWTFKTTDLKRFSN